VIDLRALEHLAHQRELVTRVEALREDVIDAAVEAVIALVVDVVAFAVVPPRPVDVDAAVVPEIVVGRARARAAVQGHRLDDGARCPFGHAGVGRATRVAIAARTGAAFDGGLIGAAGDGGEQHGGDG